MSTDDAAQTTWKKEVAGTVRCASNAGISRILPLRDGSLLLTGQEHRPKSRVYIFDPKDKAYKTRRVPMKDADAALSIPGGKVLLIKYSAEAGCLDTEFMVWDPVTNETQSFTGQMPPGHQLSTDVWGDRLSVIASSSVDGSSGGFDWKDEWAFAGAIDLQNLCIETPFHQIEDLDTSAIAMLSPQTCFVFAHSRTSSYCHLRDTRVLEAQDGEKIPNSKVKPDLSTPFFRLTWVGKDSQGGVLFAGEVYCQGDHGDTQTALFRWTLDNPTFEMVGQWNDGNCYFSEAAHLSDGSTLLFFSERQTANIHIRRYVPGQQAERVGRLTDTFYVNGVAEGADGRLYMYACKPALKDGQWLIAGEWDLYVVSRG